MGLQSYASSRVHIDLTAKEYKECEAAMKVSSVISGDNVYIVWFTNVGTGNSNYEVGFRASTDNGQTFGPITNVSNTDNYDSVNA